LPKLHGYASLNFISKEKRYNMSVNIRKAITDDLKRIIELYEELGDQIINISPDTTQRVFNEISEIPGHYFLVIEKDNYVVGTLFLQVVPNLSHNASPWAIIENVVIDRKYHRNGLGRLLMEHAIKICRESGCHKVQLMSMKKRKEAHQFYKSMGFNDNDMAFRYYFKHD
jgi:ribosomal protein S18 acetylase RimI-like enzyme